LCVFVDLLHAFVEYANAVVASAAKNVIFCNYYLTTPCFQSAARILIVVAVIYPARVKCLSNCMHCLCSIHVIWLIIKVAGRVFNDKVVVAVICILAAFFLNAVYIYTNLTALQTNESQSGSSDSISFLDLYFCTVNGSLS